MKAMTGHKGTTEQDMRFFITDKPALDALRHPWDKPPTYLIAAMDYMDGVCFRVHEIRLMSSAADVYNIKNIVPDARYCLLVDTNRDFFIRTN